MNRPDPYDTDAHSDFMHFVDHTDGKSAALTRLALFAFGLAVTGGAMVFWHYLPALCTAANDAREALLG